MSLHVNISHDAALELEEAAAWYETEQSGLGERLIDAFEHAITLLKEPNPPLSRVEGNAANKGAKKLVLYRFPFSLITVQRHQTITVVAFAHHARKPRYWRTRLTS